MRAILTVLAALALCASAAASANAQAPYYGNVTWSLRPTTQTADAVPRTEAIGNFLFTQDFYADREAVLTDGFTAVLFHAMLTERFAPVVFPPGAAFVSMQMPNNGILFCDPAMTIDSQHVWDDRHMHVCLLDTNGDGVFDFQYWGASPPTGGPFSPMGLLQPRNSPVSVPYTVRPGATRMMTAGAAVTRSPLGAYRLRFALTGADGPLMLTEPATPREAERSETDALGANFRAAEMPLTLTLGTARVELSAASEDSVTFRVLEPFDATQPLAVGYKGALPRPD